MNKFFKFIGRKHREMGRDARSPLGNQKGIALIAAVILGAVLLTLAGVYSRSTTVSMATKKGYTRGNAAFYIAMAGIQDALNRLNYDAYGNSPGEEIAANGMDDVLTNFLTNHSELIDASFGGGTYTVSIEDNDDGDGNTSVDADNTIILTSTGTKGGASSTIEALIIQPLFVPKHAVTTGDDLRGEKDLVVTGTLGSMHANDDYYQVESSATVALGVTAYDNCTGSWANTACLAGKRVKEPLPILNLSEFQSYCDFILKSDGTAEYANGGSIGNPLVITGFAWDSGSSRWENNERNIKAGMYYVDQRVYLTGNIYDMDDPSKFANITILATKHLDIVDGNYTNFKNSSHPVGIQNLFLVSNMDVETHGSVNIGSSTNRVQGIIAAGHQVDTGGYPWLKGWVTSNDEANTWYGSNPVAGETKIDRNTELIYDGNTIGPFLSDHVSLLSWKEK